MCNLLFKFNKIKEKTTNFSKIKLTSFIKNLIREHIRDLTLISNSEILSPSYNSIRCDATLWKQIRVKEEVHELHCTNFIRGTLSQIHIVFIKVSTSFQAGFIFVIYISPNIPSGFYKVLFRMIESLNYLYDGVIYFVGDFNIPEYNKGNIVRSTRANYLRQFSEYLTSSIIKHCYKFQ